VLLRVVKMSTGKIVLAPINESNVDKRDRDNEDVFKLLTKSPDALRKIKARRVFVDEIGRVLDPGSFNG
jgi:CRISPR-associated endonuclease Csn1